DPGLRGCSSAARRSHLCTGWMRQGAAKGRTLHGSGWLALLLDRVCARSAPYKMKELMWNNDATSRGSDACLPRPLFGASLLWCGSSFDFWGSLANVAGNRRMPQEKVIDALGAGEQ